MSAIITVADNSLDGISRYHTRCKIRIDSHNAGAGQSVDPIWLFDDIKAVQMSKTLKGAGQATVALTASQNFLNLVFPNDYINIYFDIGDGSGWTRTFFGFVDRIEETYQVDQDGRPTTQYHLICSDFFKAFERTMIYFNPQLAGRTDLQGSTFATPNIGGLALMSAGVEVSGSPADIIQNLILITLGFGTQFSLPPSYRPALQNRLRRRRAEFAQGKLSETAKQAIEQAGGSFEQLKEQITAESTGVAEQIAGEFADLEQRVVILRTHYGITDLADIDAVSSTEEIASLITDSRINKIFNPEGRATNRERHAFNELQGTVSEVSTLLDVVDTFTFVERRAIDGWTRGAPIWQEQGPLISLLKSNSNETINELFFDLRPLSDDGFGKPTDDPVQGRYTSVPDDIEGNVGEGNDFNGITLVPAVIVREYPFSTIDGLDLTDVELPLSSGDNAERKKVGVLFFGNIFSDKPNEPGRHVVYMPTINWAERTDASFSGPEGFKHLDVAVVRETEIMKSQLGRSDNEHFNLFDFWSDAMIGHDAKFYQHDLMPIVSPIHIMRHGLRVRTITTSFSRFSLEVAINANTPEAGTSTPTDSDPTTVASGDVVTPVSPSQGTFTNNKSLGGSNRWGYRRKQASDAVPVPSWVFHQGIDIVPEPVGQQVPVQCIADGEVVISWPDGCSRGYGNVVVVRHRFEGVEGYRYSVYAHLSKRTAGWNLNQNTATVRERVNFSAQGAPGVPNARQTPIRIKKGDPIGNMGKTGCINSGVHLHFEIDKHFPPRNDSITRRKPFTEVPSSGPIPSPPSGFDVTGVSMASNQNSCDPVEFFSTVHGIDLVAAMQGTATEDIINVNVEQDDDRGNEDPQDTNRPAAQVLEENNAEPLPESTFVPSGTGAIQNPLSRQQFIRWALLQDHWYQHNLEYLSGRIDMRGAPEIRVGYRLDLPDRDMSFYVEGVNHTWQFPSNMMTSLQVTRGQPSNPYPHYVLPSLKAFHATDEQKRTAKSRLATYFLTPDPIAVRRSIVLRNTEFNTNRLTNTVTSGQTEGVNTTDNTEQDENGIDTTYNEKLIPANSRDAESAIEQARLRESIRLFGDLANLDDVSGFDPAILLGQTDD